MQKYDMHSKMPCPSVGVCLCVFVFLSFTWLSQPYDYAGPPHMHCPAHKTRYQAWTNITKGEDNLFAAAEHKLVNSAASADGRDFHLFGETSSDHDAKAAAFGGDLQDNSSNGIGADSRVRPEVGAALEYQEGRARSWLGRKGLQRWRPEEPPAKPPEDSDGKGAGGVVPVATKFGRKRWKG